MGFIDSSAFYIVVLLLTVLNQWGQCFLIGPSGRLHSIGIGRRCYFYLADKHKNLPAALFSTASSREEVDDIFHYPAAEGAPNDAVLPLPFGATPPYPQVAALDSSQQTRAIPKLETRVDSSLLMLDDWMVHTFSMFGDVDEFYLRENRTNCIVENVDSDVRCLIDAPSYTMAHPVISFNVSAASDMVMRVAALGPRERLQPVLYVLRGVGGGKTRSLEEVRRELNRRPGVLCLGITYNKETSPDTAYDLWGIDLPCDISYALSTVSRLARSLYGKEALIDVYKRMKSQLHRLDLTSITINNGHKIISSANKYFITSVQHRRPITTFVVLVDETVEMERYCQQQKFTNAQDPAGTIRAGVLSTDNLRIVPGVDSALVISTLQLGPLGTTISKRPIRSLPLPAALDPEVIVRNWWHISEKDSIMYEAMLLFACTINNVPRAVETAAIAIAAMKSKQDHESGSTVNFEISLLELLVQIERDKTGRYRDFIELPPLRILSAMIFRKRIVLDDEAADAICRNMLTNSINENDTTIVDSNRVKRHFTPEASFLFLRAAANIAYSAQADKIEAQAVFDATENIMNEIYRFGSSLGSSEEQQKAPETGALLETVVLECLRLRWSILIAANQSGEEIPSALSQLLRTDVAPIYVRNSKTRALIQTNLTLTEVLPNEVDPHLMKISSRSDATAFIDELEGLELIDDSPLVFFRAAPGDAWDVGIKVRVPKGSSSTTAPTSDSDTVLASVSGSTMNAFEVLYILIDAKSSRREAEVCWSEDKSFEGPTRWWQSV